MSENDERNKFSGKQNPIPPKDTKDNENAVLTTSAEISRQKCEIARSMSKNDENYIFLQEKLSKKSYAHVECSLDNPTKKFRQKAKHFSLIVRKC